MSVYAPFPDDSAEREWDRRIRENQARRKYFGDAAPGTKTPTTLGIKRRSNPLQTEKPKGKPTRA